MGEANEFNPRDSLGLLMQIVAGEVRTTFERRLREIGLTAPQAGIILWAHVTQAAPPSEFARVFGTDAGAVTRQIDRLEAKGLVRREPHARDRRSVMVKLTEAGECVAPEVLARVRAANAQFAEGFAPEELAALRAGLLKLLAATDGGVPGWLLPGAEPEPAVGAEG
jgi:DNA-binding MarR family transcriptional regulator